MNKINYIIIQAGGKGTRMEHLTYNKPKCLISIKNKPLIFYLFEQFPQANFLIIADYKKEILKEYLKIYAYRFRHKIFFSNKKGTLAGIKKALSNIPHNRPFIITWSDLIFWENPLPKNIHLKNNYIGLSGKFSCRWRFKDNIFSEIKSKTYGVAGFFIFKDKNQLKNIPEEGEFVKYLKDINCRFNNFTLENADEIGTLVKYLKVTKKFQPVRPFNKIEIKKNTIVKIPIQKKGEELINYEKKFYTTFKKENFSFLPKIVKIKPLTLAKIDGKPLFYYPNLDYDIKKNILNQIFKALNTIHNSKKPIQAIKENDHDAIIGKTRRRLNEIIKLIPNRKKDFFIINGIRCINFIKKWHLLEKVMEQYYPEFYYPIHGDLTFSNTLYSPKNKKVYLIDPRGYYGKVKIYGDIDYDWAKIYYSLRGNYDQFNIKNFILKIDNEKVELKINSNKWEDLEDDFFSLIKPNKNKILFFHGIIWLSFTTYAWDNIDSILGAFYNGIYWLNIFYERYKKTF